MLQEAGLPFDDVCADSDIGFLIVKDGGRIAAAVGLEQHGRVGLLRSLVVAASRRSQGVGRCLVQKLEQAAHDAGIRQLWLLTIDADAYFEKLGFNVVARNTAPAEIVATREFTDLCPANAVLMCKSLE